MPLRVKWLKTSSIDKRTLDLLLSGIVKDEYSETRRSGFSDIAAHGSFLEAQYIERIESVLKINDPFGNPMEFPRIDFESVFFIFGTKFPNLELHNPPRGLGGFFNQLARHLHFKLSIEPIQVDLTRWITALENEVDTLEVSGAWVSNISLSNAVEAKIAIIGSIEVRPLIKNITGKYAFAFSKMQVNGILRSQPFRCELFAEGRAFIASGVEAEVKQVLKLALVKATESTRNQSSKRE